MGVNNKILCLYPNGLLDLNKIYTIKDIKKFSDKYQVSLFEFPPHIYFYLERFISISELRKEKLLKLNE